VRVRKLGTLEVSELGFGILSFGSTYGQEPEKAENIRVIRGTHGARLAHRKRAQHRADLRHAPPGSGEGSGGNKCRSKS
jgi:hypothetical protein